MTATKQATHTPGPWRLLSDNRRMRSGGIAHDIFGQANKPAECQDIVASKVKVEDAELIVRCVNSHDDLLAACKELLRLSEISDEEWAPQIKANNSARAAIAKATA
jgi:hypothetical protein